MRNPFFRTQTEHVPTRVNGSQGQIISGHRGTREAPGKLNRDWLVEDSSLILGAWRQGASEPLEASCAEWQLQIDERVVESAEGGVLIVACERALGGLHTKRSGGVAKILLNKRPRDLIRLEDTPLGHTDFFHRPPISEHLRMRLQSPDSYQFWPLPACQTVYSWPINKEHLESGKAQIVRIELEPDVLWDIDYVFLVVERRKKELHPTVDKIIYVILGAVLGTILGAVARRLFGS